MVNREKIIENMNIAKAILCNPNMITPEMSIKIGQTISDAISLLKEQEPIKPEMFDAGDGWIDCYCGNCKRELLSFNKSLNIKLPKHCNHCGQAVKWNEI